MCYGVDGLVEIVGVVTRSSSKIYFHAFFMSSWKLNAMNDPCSIHIGHLIKSVFDESGMTVSELARQIHLERTTVYSIFDRPSVDAIQLAKISIALKHNFLFDIEREFGLQAEPASVIFRIESLTPEVTRQLTALIDEIQPKS